mmetsp:Transcript_42035/g.66687  ORF Transcript_42035/g.66687 Transcript_42035/m.66687 type:complete len:208 (-) Transcript_42035:831-1454(-)
MTDLPTLHRAIAQLLRAHRAVRLMGSDAADVKLGNWEEGQLRGLRHQDIHRADRQIRAAEGREVTVEAEERHGLPIGRLLQLIQGFLLAKGDSFFVAGDLGKFQAQSLQLGGDGIRNVSVITAVEVDPDTLFSQEASNTFQKLFQKGPLCSSAPNGDQKAPWQVLLEAAQPRLAVWDCVDAQVAGYPMPRQEKAVRRTSHIQEFVKV